MNKSELIKSMSEKNKLNHRDNEIALKALLESIVESLESGDKVSLIGFGSFEVRERAARKGRNPRTKEEIDIPASKNPTFKAGKEMRNKVNSIKK
ncbi:MAG: HU family DNA-binding protein [Clostridium sp.]